MSQLIKQFTVDGFLTASECNAQKEMPLPMLVQRLIDVATLHANAIDIGYSRLVTFGATWVLSRVTLEIERMPGVNEPYSLTTWVESVTRLYSERCFALTTADGEVIARARTMWIAINISTRRPTDLTVIPNITAVINDRDPGVERRPRLKRVEGVGEVDRYRFRTCDIDFNRHVNSTRYVELLLNHWPVDFFDENRIVMFDIQYHHEALFGQEARVAVSDPDSDGAVAIEIAGEETPFVLASMRTQPR